MRTELIFLMELFLDDEVPKKVKQKIKERFQELQEPTIVVQPGNPIGISLADPLLAKQAPSMQRVMAQNPDLIPKPPVPVTPAAAQALAQRQALLAGAGKEKPENGRTGPRKI